MRILLIASLLLLPQGGDTPTGEVTLELDPDRPMRGDPDAAVVVVEFSDFKCHACEKFSLTIMPNLDKEFIESGRVKVTFVDFPLLDQDHYTTVAESVHCAGEQGMYWEMHDLLWQRIGALADYHLVQYAEEIGLEVAAFKSCLDEDRFRGRVLDDLKMTYELGLSARPTFFIGRRDETAGPNTYKGHYIKGAQNYLLYKSVIRRMAPKPEEE
jgi:protein-disulfide isomerase